MIRVGDPVCWIDDPVCAIEVHEAATAHLEARRVAFLRTLPTVREIAIVERCGEWARLIRRTDAGWREERVGSDGLLVLASVDWTVPLAELRQGVAD